MRGLTPFMHVPLSREKLVAIERAAVAAWPALQTADVDGWLWRYSGGGSQRANSVSALAFLGAWGIMMAAMMLPSATPMIALYGALRRTAPRDGPDGISTLETKSVRKKLKQPSFAAGVHRDEVYAGAELLGLELDEHIANVIEALRPIGPALGLRTAADVP